MTNLSLQRIIAGLNDAAVKYLVVGGLAVVAHGIIRFTADVDLIISLDPGNIVRALAVLKGLNYRPRAPVAIDDFADPQKRREWQETKGLKAFTLISPDHERTEVDLFIDDPLGFEEASQRAVLYRYAPGVMMPVCSVADLLKLKRAANRGKDRLDIEQLLRLYPEEA